jgi:hypothetical protein
MRIGKTVWFPDRNTVFMDVESFVVEDFRKKVRDTELWRKFVQHRTGKASAKK